MSSKMPELDFLDEHVAIKEAEHSSRRMTKIAADTLNSFPELFKFYWSAMFALTPIRLEMLTCMVAIAVPGRNTLTEIGDRALLHAGASLERTFKRDPAGTMRIYAAFVSREAMVSTIEKAKALDAAYRLREG